MTETRTQDITIDLSDDPNDDIRVARMEMAILPWKWALRDEGWKTIKIEMEPTHRTVLANPGEDPKLLDMTFKVTLTIAPNTDTEQDF